MYSLLDAFKGDHTQQATHYEQRMLHPQTTAQAQLASSSPVQAVPDKQPGTEISQHHAAFNRLSCTNVCDVVKQIRGYCWHGAVWCCCGSADVTRKQTCVW